MTAWAACSTSTAGLLPDEVTLVRVTGQVADPTNPFGLPPLTLGSHVKVTGRGVLDSEQGWLELHSLEHVEVLP